MKRKYKSLVVYFQICPGLTSVQRVQARGGVSRVAIYCQTHCGRMINYDNHRQFIVRISWKNVRSRDLVPHFVPHFQVCTTITTLSGTFSWF